jgi:hypothetical protein
MHPEFQLKYSTYYSFLIETNIGEFQPRIEIAREEIKRVRPLTKEFLEKRIPLFGYIRDKVSKQPLVGSYKIREYEWKIGETRLSNEFGRFNFFGPGGNFTFVFSVNGYKDNIVRVVIPNESSNFQFNTY